jgi:pyrimidine-specific ribonucleoside hydrolase
MLHKGMSVYLARNPAGKKFHDPLAASVAFNPDICLFKEVEMYHTPKQEWGCKEKPGSNTFIATSVNLKEFFMTLVET